MLTAFRSRLVLATLAIGMTVSVAAGCGGDGSEERGQDAGGNASAPASQLTKEEFRRRADRICVRSMTRAEREFAQYAGQLGSEPEEREEGRTLVSEEVFVPAFQSVVEGIRGLGTPRDAAQETEALVDAMQAAVDDADADPEQLLGGDIPSFSKAMELAADHGLSSCARAFEFGA